MGVLDEKVSIITGGSSGIGKAAVELFIKEGAKVVIADIQKDRGTILADNLGPSAVFINADVSKESDIKSLVEKTVDHFGKLDVMFNNAGISGSDGIIDEFSVDFFDNIINICFRGTILGMKHAAKIMKEQKSGGSIISTSSVAGIQSGYGSHLYSASKAAIISLTRTVGVELGQFGIRVNCIAPGSIPTPMLGKGFGLSQDIAEEIVDPLKAFLKDFQPLNKSGLPEDIAKTALFLASDDSKFITAQTIIVDGGVTSGKPHGEFMQELIEKALKSDLPEVKLILRKLGILPQEK